MIEGQAILARPVSLDIQLKGSETDRCNYTAMSIHSVVAVTDNVSIEKVMLDGENG